MSNKKPGWPKKCVERFDLGDAETWPSTDETTQTPQTTRKGRVFNILSKVQIIYKVKGLWSLSYLRSIFYVAPSGVKLLTKYRRTRRYLSSRRANTKLPKFVLFGIKVATELASKQIIRSQTSWYNCQKLSCYQLISDSYQCPTYLLKLEHVSYHTL